MAFSFSKLFGSKDNKFFDLFDQSTENLVKISTKLCQTLDETNPALRKKNIQEIEDLEHVGDKITHELFNELNRKFITPLDREDIHSLASSIDNIVDNIHGSAKRLDIYKINEVTDDMVKLGGIIKEGALKIQIAVNGLRNMSKLDMIFEACVDINYLENQADNIYDYAVGKLFENEKDAIQLIKYKEILYTMEMATDMCEDASDTIRAILIKYS